LDIADDVDIDVADDVDESDVDIIPERDSLKNLTLFNNCMQE
jgi:hypothetical protein